MIEQTWGFDDPVLVRFGGVAVTRAVYKTLNHFFLLRSHAEEACFNLMYLYKAFSASKTLLP